MYNIIYIYLYIINLRIYLNYFTYLNLINNKNEDFILVLMWNCEIWVITRNRLT